MNKTVKVCFSIRKNLGNALNPILIERVLGKKVIWADEYNCQTSGIGSGLRLFYRARHKIDYNKIIANDFPCQIWSAGFLSTPNDDIVPIREFNIASVRGELSKAFLEKLYNKKMPISTGDAGLLASELLTGNLGNKKYKLGIIPHDREREEHHFIDIHNNNSNSIIINVQDDPMDIIKTMSMCDCIISSSLHGLIVADSLGIPNRWVKLTDNPLGDAFKFHDYYSTFGIKTNALDINDIFHIRCDRIIDDYRITQEMVDTKKQDIISAFSLYL